MNSLQGRKAGSVLVTPPQDNKTVNLNEILMWTFYSNHSTSYHIVLSSCSLQCPVHHFFLQLFIGCWPWKTSYSQDPFGLKSFSSPGEMALFFFCLLLFTFPFIFSFPSGVLVQLFFPLSFPLVLTWCFLLGGWLHLVNWDALHLFERLAFIFPVHVICANPWS